jgi:DNA-binding NarL/FixJ family response regulator
MEVAKILIFQRQSSTATKWLEKSVIETVFSSDKPTWELDFSDTEDQFLTRLPIHSADQKLPRLLVLFLDSVLESDVQLFKKIKQHEKSRLIPLIVLSESDDHSQVRRCYENHVNAFILRPPKSEEFEKLLHTIRFFWMEIAVLAAFPSLG